MTFAEIRAAFDGKMTAIADKIRGYTKKTTVLGLDDMPAAVDAVVDRVVGGLAERSTTEINITDGCAQIGSYAFYYNKKLARVRIDKSRLNGIYYAAFYMNIALEEISTRTVIRIGEYAFKGCSSLKLCDFSRAGRVPSLDDVNAFSGIHKDCIIKVPFHLYDEWINATNWVELADRIVAV